MDKQFNDILNDCLERLLVKGETIEQCLQSYPEQAPELKPLLEVALASRTVRKIKPSPEFKARARYEFNAALQEATTKKSTRFSLYRFPRWATVVALIIGLLTTATGTVAAAGYSMPDSPLYPVKMATEQVQLQFTRSDIAKAELNIHLADRRVTEIVYMADKGDIKKIETLTENLETKLESVADLVSAKDAAELSGGLMSPPQTLAPSTTTPGTTKPAPTATIPTTTLPSLNTTGKTEDTFRTEASEQPAPAAIATTPAELYGERSKIRESLVQNEVNQLSVLRAALEKAPESTRPALLRAIAVLESRYQQAIEAVESAKSP
jgi:hypothetical protein